MGARRPLKDGAVEEPWRGELMVDCKRQGQVNRRRDERRVIVHAALLFSFLFYCGEAVIRSPFVLAQATSSFSMHKADVRVRRTPTPEYFSLYSHLSRIFAVEVADPGGNNQDLRYEWSVDGKPVSTKEVFELKQPPAGRHVVTVSISGSQGEQIFQRWTVEVREKKVGIDPDDPSELWPANIVTELSNVVTDLSSQRITVTGTVRNPTKRVVDNFAVWVMALGKDQKPVSRRILIVPQPQSLAPGETAPFSVVMENDDRITGFRVQPIVALMPEENF